MPLPAKALLDGFLQQYGRRGFYGRMWAFRRFASFLGRPQHDIIDALGAVLKMDGRQANRRMEGFEQWLQVHHGLLPISAKKTTYGVRPFFEYARSRGIITWRFRHKRRERTEALWARSPAHFRPLAAEWLDTLANRSMSVHTLRGYRCDILRFSTFLARHKRRVESVDKPFIRSWLQDLRSGQLAPITVNHRICSAKSFYTWLVERKKLARNPFLALPRMRQPKPKPRYVSEDEMLRLIGCATGVREKALIELLYATGCRISEVSSLNLAQVSFRTRSARCFGKGQKERCVFLNRSSVKALRAYLPERARLLAVRDREQEPALFVNYRGTRLLSGQMIDDIKVVATRAGLAGRVTAHVIRHSFATHLLNRGAKFEEIRDLLGHSVLESTSIYAHLVPSRIRENYRLARPRK